MRHRATPTHTSTHTPTHTPTPTPTHIHTPIHTQRRARRQARASCRPPPRQRRSRSWGLGRAQQQQGGEQARSGAIPQGGWGEAAGGGGARREERPPRGRREADARRFMLFAAPCLLLAAGSEAPYFVISPHAVCVSACLWPVRGLSAQVQERVEASIRAARDVIQVRTRGHAEKKPRTRRNADPHSEVEGCSSVEPNQQEEKEKGTRAVGTEQGDLFVPLGEMPFASATRASEREGRKRMREQLLPQSPALRYACACTCACACACACVAWSRIHEDEGLLLPEKSGAHSPSLFPAVGPSRRPLP